MQVEIVTVERLVYTGEADVVVAPGEGGQLGILPHHAPLLAGLEPGAMVIRSGDEEQFVALTGGFIEVLSNKVVILANAAEQAHEIDEQRAERALQRAQERLDSRPPELDVQRAVAALSRSRARLRVAARERSRTGSQA
jgi:F-type H+-transporting ATPase subunit epsilon